MNLRRTGLSLGVAVGLWLIPGAASAEDSGAATQVETTQKGYSYTFDDDPLGAIPQDARGARIRVRPLGKRTLLIRPRAHFVDEMLKSAENL